jgi:hypothetical protein
MRGERRKEKESEKRREERRGEEKGERKEIGRKWREGVRKIETRDRRERENG